MATAPRSTREQEVAWRRQAEAEERLAKEVARDLYEALCALRDAVNFDEEIAAITRYEREIIEET